MIRVKKTKNFASKNYSFYYAGKLGFFMFVILVKRQTKSKANEWTKKASGQFNKNERLSNVYELKRCLNTFGINFSAERLLKNTGVDYDFEKDISLQAQATCLKRFVEAFCLFEGKELIELRKSEMQETIGLYVKFMFNNGNVLTKGQVEALEKLFFNKLSNDFKFILG